MEIVSLPREKNIILTAGLKNLKNYLGLDYELITKKIVDEVLSKLEPSNIYVPTFNYDFLNLGFYDYNKSKSQIGRFSEEFRKKNISNRSFDPIFSYTSIYENIKYKNIDWCQNAFEKNSFFEDCEINNFLVLNIDIKNFISTFIHYLENKYKVSYRYEKSFKGKIMINNQSFDHLYKYYVRNLNINSSYNGKKIADFLKKKSVLNSLSFYNVKVDWYHSHDLIFELSKKIKEDNNFFIN